MSGGKEAQLAFYYQNLVAILKILKGLQAGTLISVHIEQKVHASSKEIDIILSFSDGHFEYYEVKSGEQFTNDGAQIKECLQSLFRHYKSRPATEKAAFSVIINPEYLPPVAVFAADIRRFSTNKTVTASFRYYCATVWLIDPSQISDFHTFMKMLSLDHEMSLARLKVEVLAAIESITSDLFMNADHALQKEDLLGRLIDQLLVSIERDAGAIDIQEFVETIIEWSARNEVAYQTAQGHDVRAMLETARTEISSKLQAKFPSIAIEVSPSPSQAISET